jgi:hypothetical protein
MNTAVLIAWIALLFTTGCVVASGPDELARLADAITNEPLSLKPRQRCPVAASPTSEQDGSVLETILTLPVQLHRRVISAQDGNPCTFAPSCSAYALEAIRDDALLGWVRASDRLLRCHPGNESQYELIHGRKYDPFQKERTTHPQPAKSALGALLSLVPGLGQTVGGSLTDGVHALTTVALFGLGAVAYERRGEPAKAILTGSVAGFFYVGNLYGGARAMGASVTAPTDVP